MRCLFAASPDCQRREAIARTSSNPIVRRYDWLGTGGALWADVSRPGPIYLQGDHTSIEYRNIMLRPVIKE